MQAGGTESRTLTPLLLKGGRRWVQTGQEQIGGFGIGKCEDFWLVSSFPGPEEARSSSGNEGAGA